MNITYNETFSPDCIWTIGNSGISEPVAIVSIEEVQLGFCRYEALLAGLSPTMKRGEDHVCQSLSQGLSFSIFITGSDGLCDFTLNSMKI